LENKKMPFFKVEVENTTLKTLANGLNLKWKNHFLDMEGL
jgi:hypothetical protein